MINSKQKGSRGERELVGYLREHGFTAERTQQYCGNTGEASDVRCKELPAFHIECKRVEKFNVYTAITQVLKDAPNISGKFRTIFHKRNSKPWVVIMPADDFIKLLKDYMVPQYNYVLNRDEINGTEEVLMFGKNSYIDNEEVDNG